MRPVNLIPPEQRRGDRAPLRKGALSYVIVGTLAAVLAGVVGVVMTGNQISEREAEIASLELREAQAREHAASLGAYGEFATLSASRTETVASLARSRFDWERVMHELSLVLPEDVWLTSLTGTVSPGVSAGDVSDSKLRGESSGPALSIAGCGLSHEAVAAFLQDLKDIDGVTRVGITRSELGQGTEIAGPEDSGTAGAGCRTRDFISEFDAVAVFDAVSVPVATTPTAPATPAQTADDGADAERARDSVREQTEKARDAAGLAAEVTP